MAEGQRMTAADVVGQVRDGRLGDFVREAIVLVARESMEAEISAEIGAELGEVATGLDTRGPACVTAPCNSALSKHDLRRMFWSRGQLTRTRPTPWC
jgi:hypothetical protein